MKKQGFNTAKALIAAACAASMLTLGACSSDSDSRATTTPGGGGGPVVPPPPPPPPPVNLTSALTLTVLDGETGSPLSGEVTVAATGEDALLFTDGNLLRGPWTFSGGSITLVAQGVGPIDAILTATANNYFDSSIVVSYDENTFETQSVTLTPKAFSAGSSITTATATATTLGSTGLLTTTMTAAPAVSAEPAAAGTSTSVRVKSGTIMRDASGNPVTGNVTMNVGFFPNDPNDAAPVGRSPLNSFPGGLTNIQVTNPGSGGATQSGGSFISGGLIAVEIASDTGQQVSTFDTPIEVASTISTDTINPETGVKVKSGDVIPVWSYDEGTGEWTYESTATVGAVDTVTKTANVTFSANHLSYWNLDWYDVTPACDSTVINVVDASGNPVRDNWLKLDIRRAGGGFATKGNITNGTIGFYNRVPGFNVALRIYEASTNVEIYRQVVWLCDLNGTTITVGANPPPRALVTASPTLSCTSGTAPTSISAGIELYLGADRLSGQYVSGSYVSANLNSDTRDFDLEAGKQYTFSSYVTQDVQAQGGDGTVLRAYSDRSEVTFTATDGATVNIPFEVNCFSATGATGGTGGGL